MHLIRALFFTGFATLSAKCLSRMASIYLSGGLAAVIFTDTFQTVVMLVGSIFLAVLGMYADIRVIMTMIITII